MTERVTDFGARTRKWDTGDLNATRLVTYDHMRRRRNLEGLKFAVLAKLRQAGKREFNLVISCFVAVLTAHSRPQNSNFSGFFLV